MNDRMIPIENEKNAYRDVSSNAVVFSPEQSSEYARRRTFFEDQRREINRLRNEVSELKTMMSEMIRAIKEQKE